MSRARIFASLADYRGATLVISVQDSTARAVTVQAGGGQEVQVDCKDIDLLIQVLSAAHMAALSVG